MQRRSDEEVPDNSSAPSLEYDDTPVTEMNDDPELRNSFHEKHSRKHAEDCILLRVCMRVSGEASTLVLV